MDALIDGENTFSIDMMDPNVIETICKEDSFELKPVKQITFICAEKKESREVKECGWDAYKDQDGNDIIFNPDDDGEKVPWMYAVYSLKQKEIDYESRY